MNDGITNTGEDRFGFVRNKADPLGAYSPKPSYVAYAVMARMLTGTKYVGGGYPDGAHSKNSLYWYEFRGENNESIHIVWRDGAPASKTVTVQTAEAQLEVTDIMGRVRNYTPSGGQITLTVSDEVMYIKGNIIDITQ
jgi:hypothetical protein